MTTMMRDGSAMDGLQRSMWRRLGDAARALGDAVATPRGTAPGRAAGDAELRRVRF